MANIPDSDNVVRVKLIDTTTAMVGTAESFVQPVVPGHEVINFCSLAFLLENERLGKKALFDLGVRKDYWNLPKAAQQGVLGPDSVIFGMSVEKGIDEVLRDGDIDPKSIVDDLGHRPWILLIEGQAGWTRRSTGGPEFEDRTLKEAEFDSGLTVGKFKAQDFFGDGSLYLLEAPGHQPEHICALARTKPSSSSGGATFIFLGGDICHFAGVFRPTVDTPLPEGIPASAITRRSDWVSKAACPCSFFTPYHPNAKDDESARGTPWYQLPQGGKHPVYTDIDLAADSVSKMRDLDVKDNIMVCIAHDASLLDVLPVFNKQPDKDINEWKREGWKSTTYWSWLNEVSVKGKTPRPPVVEGFWRDGKKWDYAAYLENLG
ncbi:cytochrome P450 monooxygenase andK [Colletotrichum spaethianum]|uniref:Cytochrome P450 monooxygenase andK n=1 Tax=Colletotrichum spaethianum TaxID=700344 RepID=A0AA37LEU4_9PEZI|nr:cytochrome P450 monooxygenase andK [Colletotrichum spaethianum]GKT47351.1 cytochrome P450 monooxygenase andK [Colletotrichum spaethianum]